jgi:DNA-binding CsgD family transcriptional regulator
MDWRSFDAMIASIRRSATAGEFRTAVDEAAAVMGFTYWSLMQKSESDLGFDDIQHSNYPREWLEALSKDYFYLHDPVLHAVEEASCGFWWTELPTLLPMTGRQRAYMAMAAQMGIADGFTVPIHARGEPTCLCSFALESGRERQKGVEPIAHWTAYWAMSQARKIRSLTQGRAVGLSDTERDVVRMTAQGMRPGAIATMLHLERGDILKIMRTVQRRQCARSKIQVVVKAYRNGDLTARELLM